jgi:hypothetical protein
LKYRLNFIIFAVLLSIICPAYIYSQSINIEKGVNGAGVEIFNCFEQSEFKKIGLKGGFSINGIMDFGLKASYGFYKRDGEDIDELHAAIFLDAFVLKQTNTMPISFQIAFSYGLINISDENNDIDNNGISDRHFAHGFTLGAGIYRDILIKKINISIGFLTEYTSYLYITQPITIAENDDEYSYTEERNSNIEYGPELGVVLKFTENFYPYLRTKFLFDRDHHFSWQPIIGMTMPFN